MPSASKFLERALLFTMAAHLAAMASMAICLLPGVPGTPAEVAGRAGYLAGHPWLWRLGWAPWQVTALSDVLLAVALVRTSWVPKLPAVLSLSATLAAVAFEQPNEFRWMTEGVELAREAVWSGDYEPFLRFETSAFQMVSLWAALFYTIGAAGWSWALAAAGVWNRRLTWVSIAAWGILFCVSAGPLAFGTERIGHRTIAAGNAVGFVLMMLWFMLAAEEVFRRSRPDESHGRYAPWRHPRGGRLGAILDLAANARLPRAAGELLPSPTFVSDITDVIYINYLVEADRLAPLVPAGLELQRLGPEGRFSLFTFLTYRHGNFGPALLGPLRRLLPSPIQSNWRIHVRDPRTGIEGIYFLGTVIDALPNALAARYLSEGVPMHVPRGAEITRRPDGSFRLRIEPGDGSAPDVDAELRPSAAAALESPWNDCFGSFRDFLAYCVPQDRAMSSQPWYGRITRQEICLNIPLDDCEPLEGRVVSHAAREIAGDARPLCFHVPKVAFRYAGEQYD